MSKGINYDDWPGHRSAMEARLRAQQGFPRFADAQAITSHPSSLVPPPTSARLNLQIDQLVDQINHLRGLLAKAEAEELAHARASVKAHDAALTARDGDGTTLSPSQP